MDTTGATPRLSEPQSALRELLHQLNNQLSVILAHAELLEAKALDSDSQARATQVVTGALGAMTTVKAIREQLKRLAA